jgi:hypothetical protein
MKLLEKIIEAYTNKNGKNPKAIYASPKALAALAVKNSLPKTGIINGIPIYCAENKNSVTENGGVWLEIIEGAIRASDT